MTHTIAILGADGATGEQVVRGALARGHSVRSVTPEAPQADWTDQVDVRTADLLNDDLAAVLDGCDAIINCVGLPMNLQTATNPPPLHTDGTRAVLRGMEATGIRRLVVLSAAMVASRDMGPVHFRIATNTALERILTQMGEMEQILRASDTDWTAVRPGSLTDDPATNRCTVTPELPAEGLWQTARADLAAFMLDCVETGDWVRGTPVIVGPDT
ncbi:hypothetical protein PARPLA_01151 [Rhodobacteraceae bacterium THAF1]|uniref:NAD(P)-dependent oxidoreductase n=1 Tax=Palleronia sp. THAF1 TaxID=2587842 RepID=UPI000F40FC3D|nr:NAD(P)H-binding protein [Palleronia sp. THAF1]QFU07326.1 hypothetical protein FIU81_01425 [Palleronia sp. THAF1]VDC20762.1 hypothetical protein PARPLA_01151 [Rhodobacteraceae bacterium THAF1]